MFNSAAAVVLELLQQIKALIYYELKYAWGQEYYCSLAAKKLSFKKKKKNSMLMIRFVISTLCLFVTMAKRFCLFIGYI